MRVSCVGFLFLALSGCRSFTSDPPPPAPPGEVRLGTSYLRRRQTLEIEGVWNDDTFVASRIEVEEPDDEVTIKGEVRSWDPAAHSGQVGGVAFKLEKDSKTKGLDGADIPSSSIHLGAWVKAQCIARNGELHLRRIDLRERKPLEAEELQGKVSAAAKGRLVVGDHAVRYPLDVPVVWDVQGQDPPTEALRGQSEEPRTLREMIRLVDEDDVRGGSLLSNEQLAISGELQYELEWRNNHNLRKDRKRDRLIHDASVKLELTMDLGRHAFSFIQVKADHEFVHFDQTADLVADKGVHLDQALLLLEDLPFPGVALEIGRQDIDHGREWVVDENLDAVRLWANLDALLVEMSVSTRLFDVAPEQEGVLNWFLGVRAEPDIDQELFLYVLHRRHGELVDLDRTHVGISTENRFGSFKAWLDASYVFGSEDGESVSGFGVDVSAMFVFEDVPLEPSIYAGYAFGSEHFVQTGLNDNNDRFNGVVSFRYLGELLRPELANLTVLTAGMGIRLGQNTSVDVIWHHYRQSEPSTFLRDSRLRLDPNGRSRFLGNGFDVVIGIEEFRPLEIEIDLGYFHPGSAFDSDDDGWYLLFTVEYNF